MFKPVLVCLTTGALACAGVAYADSFRNFSTHLTGANEIPARDTPAQGQATVKIAEDGSALFCKLMASNIDNVTQAHIHLGPPDQNGPVVAFLYGLVPPNGGPQNGRLSETTVTAADLRGPLAGQPLSVLIDAIRSGNAYVNVHTDNGVAPPNEGQGDFPGGEVRGQL
jgi:hypothetical protein